MNAKQRYPLPQVWFWVAGFAVFLTLVYVLKGILLPFVIGIAVAYLLDPLADQLEKTGMSRPLAASAVLAGFVAVFAALVVLLFPLLRDQLISFASAVPEYIARARAAAAPYVEKIHSQFISGNEEQIKQEATAYAGTALTWSRALLARLLDSGVAVFDILSVLIVSPVVSFYMLRDWDAMRKKIDGWLPRRHAQTLRALASEMDATLSGFLRGQGMVCVILGAIYGVALTLAGLNFGFLIGFIAGIFSFMPYVGSLIGFAAGMTVAWFQWGGDWTMMAVVAAIFGAGQLVEGNYLTPVLVGGKTGLHAVWILFALMAGGSLMGFTGVMIAVPVAAVLGVLVRFSLKQYLASGYYKGKD